MTADFWIAGGCALAFAAIHVLIVRARFLDVVPRSRWLSMAGGVAVAYVFLHILPELAAQGDTLAVRFGGHPGAIESHIYLVALAGLATFYGLERLVRAARETRPPDGSRTASFWIHIGAFALYNLLIGYLLLHREASGLLSLGLYAGAMGLHFVTNDFGLRQDHEALYDRFARWLLAAAVLLGWLAGALVGVPEWLLAALFAFLAGGVVLNVLKEELPQERRSRFSAFLIGAAAYAALMVALEGAAAAPHAAGPPAVRAAHTASGPLQLAGAVPAVGRAHVPDLHRPQ